MCWKAIANVLASLLAKFWKEKNTNKQTQKSPQRSQSTKSLEVVTCCSFSDGVQEYTVIMVVVYINSILPI